MNPSDEGGEKLLALDSSDTTDFLLTCRGTQHSTFLVHTFPGAQQDTVAECILLSLRSAIDIIHRDC